MLIHFPFGFMLPSVLLSHCPPPSKRPYLISHMLGRVDLIASHSGNPFERECHARYGFSRASNSIEITEPNMLSSPIELGSCAVDRNHTEPD